MMSPFTNPVLADQGCDQETPPSEVRNIPGLIDVEVEPATNAVLASIAPMQ
jgi:hypothetical protein